MSGALSRTHFRPTRDAPEIPTPKQRPTREVPLPKELVQYVKSFNYDRAECLLTEVEIQYFDSPMYEMKIAAYEHSNYMAEGPFGVVVLSLLHPKSMEYLKRSKKKIGLKIGSGSMRDTRKTFNYGGLNSMEEPEAIEEGVATTSVKSSKKDGKKKGGIGGFMKKSSQAIAGKISHKKESKKEHKHEPEKSPPVKSSSRGRNTLSRRKKVAFENMSEDYEFSVDDSLTVSEAHNEDDSMLDSTDYGSLPVAPMEGLLRTEAGDIWIKIKSEEPITKEKQLLKLFLQKMPKYSKLQFSLMKSLNTSDALLALEHNLFKKAFSFSVLNRREGQHTYEEILSNNEVTTGMAEFFESVGAQLIRLTGWKKFDGGLSTGMFTEDGEESYFTEFEDHEIMFYVGPMLPSEAVGDDDNIIPRRKIEQNTVLILFDEAKYPINPSIFKYEMVQTILVIRKISEDPPQYKITVASKEGVLEHKPIFELETILEPSDTMQSILLTKLINCQRASASTIPASSASLKKRRTKLEQLHQQFLEEQ